VALADAVHVIRLRAVLRPRVEVWIQRAREVRPQVEGVFEHEAVAEKQGVPGIGQDRRRREPVDGEQQH